MRRGKHVDIALPQPIEAQRRAGAGRTALAALVGAALMYFLDPDRGEQRRKDMRKRIDKMRKAGEKAKLEAGL